MFRHASRWTAPSFRTWRVLEGQGRLKRTAAVRYHGASRSLYPRGNFYRPPQGAGGGFRGIASLTPETDTIYALSSAPGKAGIAVIRVSGSACADVYKALCPSKPFPAPRRAVVRTLTEPGSSSPGSPGDVIDSGALVLSFPAPRTATGEEVLEFHVHGGSATVKAVLSAIPRALPLSSSTGAVIRYAEPGEFTRRAFLNDRLDLAQVESLGDTLAAETEGQRRAAVRGSSGALGRTYEGWRQQLLEARAEIEALIDFSEDQHLDESPAELLGNVRRLVRDMLRSVRLHETGSQRSELLRSGIRIALLGPPNAGKSSLMNLIVGREASIVSSEAGTTRDIVEANLDIRGFLCSFADTAGFRQGRKSPHPEHGGPALTSISAIEEEGIRRARQKAVDSDVVIALASIEATGDGRFEIIHDAETLRLAAGAQQSLVVVNKRDAVEAEELRNLVEEFRSSVLGSVEGLGPDVSLLTTSCREAAAEAPAATGAAVEESKKPNDYDDDPGGVHALISELARSFSAMTALPGHLQDLLGVTERQRQLLAQCRGHLDDFAREASGAQQGEEEEKGDDMDELAEPDIVLVAEHLRLAANCLAKITGRGEAGDVEEVLGVIFEKFCVGK